MIHWKSKKNLIFLVPLFLIVSGTVILPQNIFAKTVSVKETKKTDPVFNVPTVNNPIQSIDIQKLKIVEEQGRWLVSGDSLSQYGIQEISGKPGYFLVRLPKPKQNIPDTLWQNPNVELLFPGSKGKKDYTVSIQHIRRPLGISYVLQPKGKELQPPLTPVTVIPELKNQESTAIINKKGKLDIAILWDPIMKEKDNIPEINAKQRVISPTAFRLTTSGIELRNPDLDTLVAAYRDKEYDVWPLVDNHFDPQFTHQLLMDDNLKKRVIKQLIGYALLYNLNGYNLDFENINYEDRDRLTAFVRDIVQAGHAYGLTISMDVTAISDNPNWSQVYDRASLAKQLDYVVLMAYDQFGRASTVAGPNASYPWVEASVRKIITVVPPNKLILGMPLYMRTWYETNDPGTLPSDMKTWSQRPAQVRVSFPRSLDVRTLTMSDSQKLFVRFKKDIRWDENLKLYYMELPIAEGQIKIWFEDEKSLQYKYLLLSSYHLAGAAFWRKGFETKDFWQGFPL
ncbi:MAG: glycosyl hydrolase family 18 protein [Megasphaera sp.]|jgi:spore germination protein YaaH|uniref:glycosyl hydrolase family 18 protein n=1 Tax=Megasphaera sueciensis TaxID=349094 RepID=UPI003D002D88|nr:glycosyl hydrolase family 18 protein [Megasphaera sp.]